MDMVNDPMGQTSYAKAALKKLGAVSENFRIYSAGWLGDKPADWDVMEVKGADFRLSKSGPNKGKLVIMVKGTQRRVFVTKAQMREFSPANAAVSRPRDQATETPSPAPRSA